MPNDPIKDVLTTIDAISLAYTVKTSSAASPDEFLEDLVRNKAIFADIKKQHTGKTYV